MSGFLPQTKTQIDPPKKSCWNEVFVTLPLPTQAWTLVPRQTLSPHRAQILQILQCQSLTVTDEWLFTNWVGGYQVISKKWGLSRDLLPWTTSCSSHTLKPSITENTLISLNHHVSTWHEPVLYFSASYVKLTSYMLVQFHQPYC